jgi:hypothetical protein
MSFQAGVIRAFELAEHEVVEFTVDRMCGRHE